MTNIYGVDTEKQFTPKDVRDAITRCFKLAHGDITEKSLSQLANDFTPEAMGKLAAGNIEIIVRRAFQKSGGDFDDPDKESLVGAINYLREFSKVFRKPEVIEKHYNEIMQLIKKLK